jgi:peroxiredoxin
MTTWRILLGSAALAALLSIYPAVAAEPLRVGDPVPEFEAVDESGRVHRLSQYAGKVVVLEWTNPDCPYVDRHYRSKTMDRLARKYGGRGVAWLAVNSTHYNTPDDTRKWRSSQAFEHPTLQDARGELGRRFGARTTPHMFIIDDQAVLRYAGAIDDSPRGPADRARNYVDSGLTALLAASDLTPTTTQPYGCSVKYK